MTRTLSRPLPKSELSLDDVQHFVLEDASWELYERLLRDIGSRPIRVTYDNGRLEITSPLPEHERVAPSDPATASSMKARCGGESD